MLAIKGARFGARCGTRFSPPTLLSSFFSSRFVPLVSGGPESLSRVYVVRKQLALEDARRELERQVP